VSFESTAKHSRRLAGLATTAPDAPEANDSRVLQRTGADDERQQKEQQPHERFLIEHGITTSVPAPPSSLANLRVTRRRLTVLLYLLPSFNTHGLTDGCDMQVASALDQEPGVVLITDLRSRPSDDTPKPVLVDNQRPRLENRDHFFFTTNYIYTSEVWTNGRPSFSI
jgi:hypothetical protein